MSLSPTALFLRLSLGLLSASLSFATATPTPTEPKPYQTAATTGTILLYGEFPSVNVRARDVYVWLPPSYQADPTRRYPVLYMHDGQCLFDPAVSLSRAEWGIDESMTKLIASGEIREAIVVGVGNTPLRYHEYVPSKVIRHIQGSGSPQEKELLKQATLMKLSVDPKDFRSDEYLSFLVTELKPFIDSHYRSLPDRANTLVAGSSLGGQISLYAICEYPDIFGSAACISTHWPVADGATISYLADTGLPSPKTHRLYFDFGTATLDETYEPYQKRMDALLDKAGYQQGRNWLTEKFPGANHSENAWRDRAPVYLKFLLGKQ